MPLKGKAKFTGGATAGLASGTEVVGPAAKLAVVTQNVQAGASPTRVLYFGEDGFLLLDDAAPANPDDYHDELVVLCVHCIVERFPEAGKGMDVALRSGAARYMGESWIEDEAA